MNLLIYIRSRNRFEIFTLVNTKKFQHLVEAQAHDTVQQNIMGVFPFFRSQYHSHGLNCATTY
jgi:hypothetical protein